MLLPKIMQFRDPELSTPLGPAIQKVVSGMMDPVIAFEVKNHFRVGGEFIREKDCRQIKGAAQEPGAPVVQSIAPPTPVAAPPSTEKPPFKVGDRVRRTTVGMFASIGDTGVIVRFDRDGDAWVDYDESPTVPVSGGERVWCASPANLELIPSEPKEADGWLQCGPFMPRVEMGGFDMRNKITGEVFLKPKYGCLSTIRDKAWVVDYEYRLVKQQ